MVRVFCFQGTYSTASDCWFRCSMLEGKEISCRRTCAITLGMDIWCGPMPVHTNVQSTDGGVAVMAECIGYNHGCHAPCALCPVQARPEYGMTKESYTQAVLDGIDAALAQLRAAPPRAASQQQLLPADAPAAAAVALSPAAAGSTASAEPGRQAGAGAGAGGQGAGEVASPSHAQMVAASEGVVLSPRAAPSHASAAGVDVAASVSSGTSAAAAAGAGAKGPGTMAESGPGEDVITVKLLLSIDRREDAAAALETVR